MNNTPSLARAFSFESHRLSFRDKQKSFLLAFLLVSVAVGNSQAQTLTWDPSGNATTGSNGTGVWNTTSTSTWTNGTGTSTWVSGDSAVVGVTGGSGVYTITVGS